MSINRREQIIEKLIVLLAEPWDSNAELNLELFHEIGQLHCTTILVSNLLSTNSLQIIKNLSGLLADVEEYKIEISALYMWIEAVSDKLDEQSRGNLTTAIQRHILSSGTTECFTPSVQRVMIPFLLQCLIADDWTIRLSAVRSLDMLDGYCRLGKWLTKVQLGELRQNLRVHLALDEEQELSPSAIGRLKRFVKK